MISPRYATMFCFVQTDAVLARRRVDLLTGVCVKRSFDRITVDGQLSTSDTVVVQAGRRVRAWRWSPRPRTRSRLGEALDALMRQLALEIVADGEGARADRAGDRARPAPTPWSRGPLGGQLPAREDRAERRRPELRPRPPGGGPGLAAGARASSVDLEIEGRQVVSAGDALDLADEEWRELVEAFAAPRGGVRAHACPARAARPRCSSATCRRATCASTRATRHEGRSHPPRGAPVHPGVPRRDRGDQVRRRGHDRPGAHGGLRPRRGAPQVRGHEPGGGARRRPRHHPLHGAARHGGALRGRPARVRRGHGRGGQDGAGRQAEQGHRAAASTATASPRWGCAATTAGCSPSASSSPARPTWAWWARSSAWTSTCSTTSPRTTSRWWPRWAPTARAAPTT